MANFQHHLVAGIAFSSVCSVAGYLHFGLSEVQALSVMTIGTTASIAPDIDHSISVPARILFDVLAILLPIIALPYLYLIPYLNLPKFTRPKDFHIGFALEEWIVYFSISYIFVKFFLFKIFTACTVHRGIFHSIPAMIIFGQLLYLSFAHLEEQQQIFMGVVSGLGYGVHLVMDELYSVDWQDKNIKKSFGSAIDFGNFKELSTWLAYLILGGLSWLIYTTL
ncbi:MAG TPA: metal-dependent hydrolase [Planctomycetota bacterium]|nr:metal-dependent hydrolase [Planctomycetota bacterium]